ncbi:chloramphenicol acetyltransferase [Sediminicola sp. 1XM1-17]|uniref:chloramphenicol acetyltransferase n=1 Tax=Sediminicola sp. 1XM1-17 TaxID=3127702 RepID=UPI003076EE48
MGTYLDMDSWNRKEHFHFFNGFEEPFWGITVDMDCTIAYQKAKEANASFFLWYLHKSIRAINQIPEFKYRIDSEDRVVAHDTIGASPTINRPNGTFGFSYMDFYEDFVTFQKEAQKEIERVQAASDLIPAANSDAVVHYSSLPWLKFTSFSHARKFSIKDSIPKISFGKMTDSMGNKTMPVSIHVHHGLVDGVHMGRYVELFQQYLNEK